ncbi:MAG: CBS domain-containing protein [Gemmataceae bacterium]|nr:CBS domain-containing protein [Gemmataceae bacterium]
MSISAAAGLSAGDIMTSNPLAVVATAAVSDAISIMAAQGVSALPVIDAAGRLVGTVSQFDIVQFERDQSRRIDAAGASEARVGTGGRPRPERSVTPEPDAPAVESIMTPGVFAVARTDSLKDCVRKMLDLNVHRVFVRDTDGRLIGVVSMKDVLRRLVSHL